MASTNVNELRVDNIVDLLYGNVFGVYDENFNHKEVILTHLTEKWMCAAYLPKEAELAALAVPERKKALYRQAQLLREQADGMV